MSRMGKIGAGMVAHHIIPLEAITKFRTLVERAARGGFNINGCNNGILLKGARFGEAIEHFGGHPEYNRVILDEIGRLARKMGNLTDEQIAQRLQGIADKMRQAILNGDFYPLQ